MQNHTARTMFASAALALCGFLAACNNTPSADLNKDIEAGNAAGPLGQLTTRLEQTPEDPVLNALALKARLRLCAMQQCLAGESAEAEKSRFAQHQKHLAQPATLEDGTTLTVDGIFAQAAGWFAEGEDPLPNTFAAMETAPAAAKPAYPNALFARMADKTPQQMAPQLTAMLQTPTVPKQVQNIAGLLLAEIQDQDNLRQSYLIALRNHRDELSIPPAAAHALARILRQRNGALFAEKLIPTLTGYNLPAILEPGPLAAMGTAIRHDLPPAADASATLPMGTLQTMALSLTLNPNQPELWQRFLPQAEAAALQQNATNLFEDLTRFAPLPAAVQSQFLTSIFKVIETAAAEKKPILPLLRAVENIKLDKANETRLEKLVQSGLSTAIAADDLNQVMAYGRFRPAIAQASAPAISSLVVTAIRTDLKSGNYDHVIETATILTEEVGINFDLDTLLLQELADDFKTRDIAGTLSTDSPEHLLKQRSAAALDLGPLFGFLKSYFAENPAPLNDQLKSTVSAARGHYGLPTALYRLWGAFDDTAFPPDERAAYLATAISTALESDQTRSPAELVSLLGELTLLHKGISLPPLVATLLDRNRTLEQSRAFWQAASGNARTVLSRTHPQFASLMQGIDAAEKQQWNAAADYLGTLGTPSYGPMAGPYITEIRTRLAAFAGLYAAQTYPLPQGAPAFIHLAPVALRQATDTLTRVEVTTVNPLGSLAQTNPATYATDAAALVPAITPARADLAALTLAPLENTPTNPFDKLTVLPGKTPTLTWQSGQATAAYTRLLANPTDTFAATGTFSVVGYQTSPTMAGQTILPVGSMLELTREGTETRGVLWHPASTSPLDVTVTTDPAGMATTLHFAYPLPNSGKPVEAQARCQLWPGYGLCGAHHAHNQRNQHTTLIIARQTAESIATQQKELNARNTLYATSLPNILSQLPVLPVNAAIVQENAPPVPPSGTVTLLGPGPSGSAILPAPLLEEEEDDDN